MEQTSVSVWKSSLTYGLYLGLAMIITSVAFYATGNTFAKSVSWVSYALMIAGIIIAQLQYRKQLGGYMTYAQALGVGVLTILFASVVSSFFTYLLFAVIDPSLQDQMKLAVEEQLVRQGKVPEDQMESVIEMTSRFQTPPMMFFMGIVGGTFMGFLVALLTSIFTRKKSVEDFS